MATGDIAQVDNLGSLVNLANMFKGQNTGSSGTKTTTTASNITPEGMQAIINQILGSANGLSAVASGQKSAGLYNSSTNELLVNDLITRTAGELAKQQAGTTTTTNENSNQKKQAPFNPNALLGLMIGQSVLGPTLKTGYKKLGLDDLGKNISDSIFGGGSSFAADAIPSTEATLGSQSALDALAGSSVAPSLGTDTLASLAGGSIGTDALASTGIDAATAGELNAGASALGDVAGGSLLADAATTGAGDVAGFTALDSAAMAGGDAALTAGAADVAGSAAVDAGASIAADAAVTEGGAAAAEAAGSAGLWDTIGSAVVEYGAEAAAAWVICTELKAQGVLDEELYNKCSHKFLRISKVTQRGYQVWAIPVTRHIRRHPTGIVARFFTMLAKSRCEYLLGKPRVWGWLTVKVMQPICTFIGRHATPEDYRNLYAGH